MCMCATVQGKMHVRLGRDIRTLAQIRTVTVLGHNVGNGFSHTARATLPEHMLVSLTSMTSDSHMHAQSNMLHDSISYIHCGLSTSRADRARRHLLLAGRNNDATVLSWHNTHTLVVHKTRVLVAVKRGNVAGFAREHTSQTLLLHKEAVRLAHKQPLEILCRHLTNMCVCIDRWLTNRRGAAAAPTVLTSHSLKRA